MTLILLMVGIGNIFVSGICWGIIRYSEQVDFAVVPVKMYVASIVCFLFGIYSIVAMIGRLSVK